MKSMDYDEKNTDELEAELYSRIHHEKPDETIEMVAETSPAIQYSRIVTKHSIVNNSSKMHKKAAAKSAHRKKAIDKCNPNPFAIASAMDNHIPKRLTPYTSYLSQVDSQPIDLSPVTEVKATNAHHIETDEQKLNERRPNPFNQGFNRVEEKMKRYQHLQAKKAHAHKVREVYRQKKENIASNTGEIVQNEKVVATRAISVQDSDTDDDDIFIYPPEIPQIIHISDDEEDANETIHKEPERIDNLHNTCDDINVDYDKHLSRHDDPFGDIDVAHLNTILSECPSSDLPPVSAPSDQFAKPQRANRHALKRSYDVSETDFAAVDVYESENSDLPEPNVSKSRKITTTVQSESEASDIDIDTTKRSKRMRKRRKSGSNRGSDYISSDESDDDDDDDDAAAYLEPAKTNRPYYLHRGEGVFNAVTKYSKRLAGRRIDQNVDVGMKAIDSSDDSATNDAENEDQNNCKEKWIVTDAVGETDSISIDLNNLSNCADADGENVEENNCANDANENINEIESNVDKDDDNSVRSKRLVIHPEMGWNSEMKAFYNDSWGGETHNTAAIRKEMPRDNLEWRLDVKDLRSNYNPLKQVKCHNCRENGHRMAFCPQPKKEIVCYTCGNAGHREVRCPYAICLKCGEKTNSYRRGCERCFRMPQILCSKCRRRGHFARDCPDNWRAYHNTIDPVSVPKRVPTNRPKKYCSACAGYGHRAEQCYDFQLLLQDDIIPSDIRHYEKVYADDAIDNSMTTPYSMFENPREDFQFNWNVNESRDRIYGRFMEATKIRRDAVGGVRAKRLAKVKIAKLNENLVLNPMNAQNIREKPKKQFVKNFYEEPTSSTQNQQITEVGGNADNSVDAADATGDCAIDIERSLSVRDTVEGDNDVVMKEVEQINLPTVSSVQREVITEEDKVMQEAIEVDELRGSMNFSFTKEMDELEKTKALFDLSFIGTTCDHSNSDEIDDSPTTTKVAVRKMHKAAEIEQLTEMEISLSKLKDKLSRKKTNDDIVLNVTNDGDQSTNCVHDSDSNYSFGEYFNESKSKDHIGAENDDGESPDYIPLPPHIDSSDIEAASDTIASAALNARQNSAKIFLTKQHARLLLSTDGGNKLLSDASSTHQVKVRMDWENLGNVLIVVGSTANQNKFHADLIRFLVEMCKKMRIKNETFQQIPRSKVALIRFIREQFALLEQPLGNVNELFKNMKRNENLKSKNGTKNADRARKHLNIILMGRAGLRDGRLHLAGLESNLKFLLENTKDMMTKHTREEIYQHYRYVFSPFEHDDYPDLIAEYEGMKRAKSFPPLNIDKNLLDFKISVKDDACVDLNRAKQKLMRVSNDIESPKQNSESVAVDDVDDDGSATIADAVAMSEPKTPTRDSKNVKREQKTPKRELKTPKSESKAQQVQTKDIIECPPTAIDSEDNSSNVNKNEIWSLKCKDIVEQCRQKHIKSSKVVDKLNTVLEKASRNQLSYADYKNLEKILNTLNRNVN